jgi:nicotinate-nucleotide pyrophosphorylase (carboxylating)
MPPAPPPLDQHLLTLIQLAVREDLAGDGKPPRDLTVNLAIPESLLHTASIVARKPGTLAGTFLIPAILQHYDPAIQVSLLASDASRLTPNQPVARLQGPARALLSAERVLLNFLGHLSGIATLTRAYADAIAAAVPDPARRPALCDTRKTTPAFRALDKYAVRCGGGTNDRIGLYDGVMLKDNHLAALREKLGDEHATLAQLTQSVRAQLDPNLPLWLEVDTLDQLKEELAGHNGHPGGADIILLDNFTTDRMRQAVALRDAARSKIQNGGQESRILLEASGGITLANLPAVAQTGVDRISIGALTHSAPILDLSMEFA